MALISRQDTPPRGREEVECARDLARQSRNRRAVELARREPARGHRGSRRPRGAPRGNRAVDEDSQAPVNDCVPCHKGTRGGHGAQAEGRELAPQGEPRSRARRGLPGRELPELSEEEPGALDEERAILTDGVGRGDEHVRHLRRRWAARIPLGVPPPARHADRRDRAGEAVGTDGPADQLAQVHERRRRVARTSLRKHARGVEQDRPPMGRAPRAARNRKRSREDARDVGLRGRDAAPVRQGRDGRRDVLPEPGQRPEGLRVLGKSPAVFPNHLPRRAAEISRPRVVPESRPRGENGLLPRAREGPHVGEARQEALVPGPHRADRGLLQHDLGDPDPIGVARPAPGQGPLLIAVPGEEEIAEGASRRLRLRPGASRRRRPRG